ncbi:glycosyl hydrolase family 28 protein [Limibacter armeniacum]|uniref:glycosyl hydrolase family 28 protein n=1 Tax=Limibacter armeniacum TaxID=466084 RepID=UPI002FE55956
MTVNSLRSWVTMLLYLWGINAWAKPAEVSVYRYHAQAPEDTDYEVWVDGQKLFVYDMPIAGMASFGATEQVIVRIKPKLAFEQVVIRPTSLGIVPEIEKGEVRFSIPADTKVSVEFDNRIYNPLYVFSQTPVQHQEADLVFEAGKHYRIGKKRVKSGQRVWIQAGSVVEGFFVIEDVENTHIFGHGIIDNRHLSREEGYYGFGWINARHSTFEHVHLIGNPRWSTAYFGCDSLTVNDVRIIGWRPSDDGVDLVGSTNMVMSNAFIRTKDDCIAIKASTYLPIKPAPDNVPFRTDKMVGCKQVKNIRIEQCILWNADWGNAIEIGFETRADVMEDIRVENCDIIHVEGNGGAFSIHNGDRATVRNIYYKDIRIEGAKGFLCHFQILHSHYSKDSERGRGENIILENISVLDGYHLNSIITGLDTVHQYKNIRFKNLSMQGRKVRSVRDGNIYTEYAQNISFE